LKVTAIDAAIMTHAHDTAAGYGASAMLFDPRAHEPLVDGAWRAAQARATLHRIARAAEDALTDRWWPVHPLDVDEGDPEVWHGVYLGAAGVVWALDRLGYDQGSRAEAVLASYLEAPEFEEPSMWVGEGGVALVAYLQTRAPELADRLHELVAVPERDTLELLWGSPGLLIIADVMAAATGEPRWDAAAEALAAHLLARDPWVQDLYGKRVHFLGAGHGSAGIVLALARRRPDVLARAKAVLSEHAIREGELANWPPVAGEPLVHNDTIHVQWCHGAPGMVTSLAGLPPDDELDALLLAGGELTWAAGPLAKGPGLCHGTAGNGFAFLKLFARTQDELWLARARRFAVHAAARLQGRHTLWTGDLGVAIYLDQCLKATAEMPALDAW
jgi:hypothetical protein